MNPLVSNETDNARKDWQPAVAPFRELDPVLEEFAIAHGLQIEGIDSDRSSRTFRREGPVGRLIQIHLDSDNDGRWYVWISAFEDKQRGRHWKGRNLKGPTSVSELRPDVIELLDEAWAEISNWY